MSRIGKLPVVIPAGVTVTLKDNPNGPSAIAEVTVTG